MKKLLFISPYLPLMSGSGGVMRTYQIYEELKVSFEVDFMLADPATRNVKDIGPFKRENNFLGTVLENCWKPLKVWARPGLHEKVKEALAGSTYDYVFVRYYSTAYWLGLIGLEKLILDCDDCLSETNGQAVQMLSRKPVRRSIFRCICHLINLRYVKDLSRCKAVLFAKKSGAIKWSENYYECPNKIFPVSGIDSSFQDTKDRCLTVLFIGMLGYYPNYHGLDHFIRHVWKRVCDEVGCDVKLKIVGAGLPEEYACAWRSDTSIELCGYVEDINRAYEGVDLSVVPMYQGSGTHIKVIESLLRGVPTVVTPLAHRGFECSLADGESLLVAKDDDEFRGKVVRMLMDKAFATDIAENGKRSVENKFLYSPGNMKVVEMMGLEI
ncbi:glycosyltransferase [Teredinibacter purpureus]|uniref:glycosyltransferase n=1 Tax=Teredinibacter purpureus TaxID=2731756 RepID=UPI0005F7B051|nr:glycosyltransferase [Teredinibacter purpureus]